MDIILRPQSEEPLYLQIYRQILEQIASGAAARGESLPSVRVAARYLGVAVVTVKTAYDRLQEEGYVSALQGKGYFISDRAADLCRETRVFAEKACDEFLGICKKSGMSKDDIFALIAEKMRS